MILDEKYDDSIKSQIETMFNNNMTYKEIGKELDIPRRTVGKLCKKMGLSRSSSDTASLVLQSHLDDEETIKEITLLRPTHSLQEIATRFNSSISAVQRICNKYDISLPDDYKELQSKRMKDAWTDEKKTQASITSKSKVTDELRKQLSEGSKRLWMNADYKRNQGAVQSEIWDDLEKRNEMSLLLTEIWSDPELRKRMSDIQSEIWSDPELRKRMSDIQSEIWSDPARRDEMRRIQTKIWSDPAFQEKMALMRSRTHQPIVSSIQQNLYSILDDLDINYYREYEDKENDRATVIGPYNFDCVIPRADQPDLLIECQGDYFHSKADRIVRDNQKRTYIINNFPEYELKYLWEHEFKCKGKIHELIKYWMGISEIDIVDFTFDNVQLREINVKTANKLLDKYHYLSGCGRGGIMIGAFIGGNLIAVCVFSTLLRGNMPYDKDRTRELSRFCIHPKYQKKNFGSWMITRCIKMLPEKITTVVSYCDTTFNHDGALYKACNFRFDGEIRPDYWYVNEDRWVMHKKTLYNHACKMGLKEREFAEKEGYKRVYGDKKLRFIFERLS